MKKYDFEIGIVIPIKNADSTIERCLKSIFAQTFNDFYLCCVDDGSTDNTSTILKDYSAFFPNKIKILHNNGKLHGPSIARNIGISFLKNKAAYMIFIDSDDFIEPDYLFKLHTLAKKNNCEIVCSSFYFSHPNSNKSYKYMPPEGIYTSYDASCLLLNGRSILSQSWGKIFTSSLWDELSYPEGVDIFEDYAVLYKVFLKSSMIYVSQYCGYHYWLDNESLLRRKYTNSNILNIFDVLNQVYTDCLYDRRLSVEALQFFAKNYLMLLPRINVNELTVAEKERLLFYKKFFSPKIMRLFNPSYKVDKRKKRLYLFNKKVYIVVYKFILSRRR